MEPEERHGQLDRAEIESLASGKGPLAWAAKNPVFANVILVVLVMGGIFMGMRLKQEVFPEVIFPVVVVQVPYPGASPEEVETGTLLVMEEAVRGIDGVKRVTSTALEGMGVMSVEFLFDADENRGLQDVKAAIDRITTFPDNAERPNAFLASNRQRVVSLVVYGDTTEDALRELTERTRAQLLQDDRITYVEITGDRPPEISVEVPQENLRRYGLTLDQIAQRIRAASIDLPGGGVKTDKGEILLRTAERREQGTEFGDIVILSRPDGTKVRLSDIAQVKDQYIDNDQAAFFNGKRAMMVDVFRVGDETPIAVSDAVEKFVNENQATLPPGISYSTFLDSSEIYEDRVDLLQRNAIIGFILVLIVLGLFLEAKLAFWVTLGIPVSFLGAFMLMPVADVSINMISLFAFIVVLGLVVDDAIVSGEAIYQLRSEGVPPMQAAIAGVRMVAKPVLFAVISTMIFFSPMLFVPGFAGEFFRNIPLVVILTLLISLVESLLILPAHLAHSKPASSKGAIGWLHRQQQKFASGLEWFIEKLYVPFARRFTRRRYLTMAASFAFLIACIGLVAGGRVNAIFMPKIEGELVVASIEMPFGVSAERTAEVEKRIRKAALETMESMGGDQYSRGLFSQLGGSTFGAMGGPAPGSTSSGGHIAEVAMYLVEAGERPFAASEFVRQWRQRIGEITGIDTLKFKYDTGGSGQAPVSLLLSHRDNDVLKSAADELASKLRDYAGVFDVDDGFRKGKEQLSLQLRPEAESLGLTEAGLAQQVRSAFFGAEATRQQRARDELRVYVRYPEAERKSEHDVESLLVRTPGGGEIPLGQAATVDRGTSYTEINREEGRRAAEVTADIDYSVTTPNEVMAAVTDKDIPALMQRYPELKWSLGGEQRDQQEINDALLIGFLLALVAVYALLAIPFGSYIQPVIILIAIPFGIVGAILGHWLLGYDMSLMSNMGVVALSGVVVNDSLILVVAINEYREKGLSPVAACIEAGARRFRPILLTSLTTFFGLAPMILETSVQAKFLVPMAISLGFGVMFATFITLVLVPALYLIIVDAKWFFRLVFSDEPAARSPASASRT